MNRDYERIRTSLLIEERESDDVASPLALLLNRIWDRAHNLLGVAPDAFLDWLETTAPIAVSEDAGTGANGGAARLADAMDELDTILLAALEEVAGIGDAALARPDVEARLVALWRTTFTAVATAQEAWLEQGVCPSRRPASSNISIRTLMNAAGSISTECLQPWAADSRGSLGR